MGTTDKKFELARRLRVLTEDFRLTWDQPASVYDGDVGVSVDRMWDDNDQLEYLVTVSAGFPPPEGVRGLPWTLRDVESREIVRVGATDRRGQTLLRRLPKGNYLLELQGLDCGTELDKDCEFEVDHRFAYAHSADELLSLELHTAGLHGQLRVDSGGHLVLEIEVDTQIWEDCGLARFRIFDGQNVLLGQGFLGLYPNGNDKACAFIDLDILDPTIREKSADCRFVVQPAAGLTREDREVLERSLAATLDPLSRDVLQRALEDLRG